MQKSILERKMSELKGGGGGGEGGERGFIKFLSFYWE